MTDRTISRPITRLVSVPMLAMIRAYQYVTAGRPSPCRFDPTCSSYALESISVHGPVRGLGLTVRRIARCHPWGGQGYDPVPLREAHK